MLVVVKVEIRIFLLLGELSHVDGLNENRFSLFLFQLFIHVLLKGADLLSGSQGVALLASRNTLNRS